MDHYKFDGYDDMGDGHDVTESVDELKAKLQSMKKLMGERKAAGADTSELFRGRPTSLRGAGLINGNFLSFVFGSALCVIVSVSIYAFYNLYHAVLKRFPSRHTEL
ncbi:uncharacterized protein LOC143914082 [Arctopsyche grandis]|uniref:uncharacterized protein LOC143914082 n=1 Tax=Arctopsyche grandis TaxID=121162 RepID=UPI00406D90EE